MQTYGLTEQLLGNPCLESLTLLSSKITNSDNAVLVLAWVELTFVIVAGTVLFWICG